MPPWTFSLMHQVHFFCFTLALDIDPLMLLQPDVIPG
jgi:hypothetical protein